MEQESTYKDIAVVGLGAAGGLACILLSKNIYNNVVGFDLKEPFSTLLPTGGGRCNLTYDENDIREFAKNYPRGEKFLLSVFSKFNQSDTRKLFKDLGIKTYVQDDKRVFPISDSSKTTIKILNEHLQTSNFNFKQENVLSITKSQNKFLIKTNNNTYEFDKVIIATGGKSFNLAKNLGHNIISPHPSLCSLNIREKNFYKLAGVSFKNTTIKGKINNKKYKTEGDILFAHKFISGPGIFKLSAISAYEDINENNPLEISIDIIQDRVEELEDEIKHNPKKSIKNVFSKFAPHSFIFEILNLNNIDPEKQIAQIKKTEKEIIINSLKELKLTAINRVKDSEIVTAGGVDLKEINPLNMESKIIKGLYFIGEVLNIDGFTGGFNLQNCWSGAYLCSLDFNIKPDTALYASLTSARTR